MKIQSIVIFRFYGLTVNLFSWMSNGNQTKRQAGDGMPSASEKEIETSCFAGIDRPATTRQESKVIIKKEEEGIIIEALFLLLKTDWGIRHESIIIRILKKFGITKINRQRTGRS